MAMTYELLLDLYRGKSMAVEQIGDAEVRRGIAIGTPVTHLLERIERDGTPRHVVLTGAAGDGKTFAALTARVNGFCIITDASARRLMTSAMTDPVDDVIAQMEEALVARKRLLVAVNRGQLERLIERRERLNCPQARALLQDVQSRIVPRESWPGPKVDVGVVDLSHLDRASTVQAMLQKIVDVEDSPLVALEPRTAFSLARAALKAGPTAAWVSAVVRAAASGGRNPTMRQMWSFLAFLATGGRSPDDRRALTLDDAVGSRLFTGDTDNPLFVAARELDPALTPNARFTKRVLTGEFAARVQSSPLGALVSPAGPFLLVGRQAIRIGAVHGLEPSVMLSVATDHYAEACRKLIAQGQGWHSMGHTRRLFTAIYDSLGLWRTNDATPAWEVLCYDASRLEGAALVADRQFDASKLKLAVPWPPPELGTDLLSSWRPPFIWLGTPDGPRLRLFPRVFRALIEPDGSSISREDLFAADRWVGRSRPDGAPGHRLRVARRHAAGCLVVDQDDLEPDWIAMSIEGGVRTGGSL